MFKLQFLFYFAFIKWKISNPEYLYRRTAAKKKLYTWEKTQGESAGLEFVSVYLFIFIFYSMKLFFFELWIFYL